MTFQEIWDKIVNFFKDNYLNIIKFFSILIIGIIVVTIIMRIIKHAFNRRNIEKLASRFILTIIRFILILVLILILLSSIGVEVTGFTTALSAVLLAIGMALKENISNVANGIILVSSKKYKQGDYIVVNGVEGSIVDINFMFTTLKTPDGKQITMPNTQMVNNPVTNFGAYEKRRVSYDIDVAYESDVELVKKVVIDCFKSCGMVDLDPAPNCRLKYFKDSAISFFCTAWCDSADYWEVYYTVIDRIYNEFKRNGIVIPYQQIEIRQRTDKVENIVYGSGLPKRVDKVHDAKKKSFNWEDLEDKSLDELIQMKKEAKKKTSVKKKTSTKKKETKKAE